MVDRGTAMPPDALALSEGWNVMGKITEQIGKSSATIGYDMFIYIYICFK